MFAQYYNLAGTNSSSTASSNSSAHSNSKTITPSSRKITHSHHQNPQPAAAKLSHSRTPSPCSRNQARKDSTQAYLIQKQSPLRANTGNESGIIYGGRQSTPKLQNTSSNALQNISGYISNCSNSLTPNGSKSNIASSPFSNFKANHLSQMQQQLLQNQQQIQSTSNNNNTTTTTTQNRKEFQFIDEENVPRTQTMELIDRFLKNSQSQVITNSSNSTQPTHTKAYNGMINASPNSYSSKQTLFESTRKGFEQKSNSEQISQQPGMTPKCKVDLKAINNNNNNNSQQQQFPIKMNLISTPSTSTIKSGEFIPKQYQWESIACNEVQLKNEFEQSSNYITRSFTNQQYSSKQINQSKPSSATTQYQSHKQIPFVNSQSVSSQLAAKMVNSLAAAAATTTPSNSGSRKSSASQIQRSITPIIKANLYTTMQQAQQQCTPPQSRSNQKFTLTPNRNTRLIDYQLNENNNNNNFNHENSYNSNAVGDHRIKCMQNSSNKQGIQSSLAELFSNNINYLESNSQHIFNYQNDRDQSQFSHNHYDLSNSRDVSPYQTPLKNGLNGTNTEIRLAMSSNNLNQSTPSQQYDRSPCRNNTAHLRRDSSSKGRDGFAGSPRFMNINEKSPKLVPNNNNNNNNVNDRMNSNNYNNLENERNKFNSSEKQPEVTFQHMLQELQKKYCSKIVQANMKYAPETNQRSITPQLNRGQSPSSKSIVRSQSPMLNVSLKAKNERELVMTPNLRSNVLNLDNSTTVGTHQQKKNNGANTSFQGLKKKSQAEEGKNYKYDNQQQQNNTPISSNKNNLLEYGQQQQQQPLAKFGGNSGNDRCQSRSSTPIQQHKITPTQQNNNNNTNQPQSHKSEKNEPYPVEPCKDLEKFILGKVLGFGSYAVVRVVTDMNTKEQFALKTYEKRKLQDPQKKKNVAREVKILSKIKHANIIRLFDVIESSTQLHLVMEFPTATPLNVHIKQKPNQRLGEEEAKIIFKQLVEAVKHCHRKSVVHRDIKLENILYDSATQKAKLIDFGFSIALAPGSKLNIFCGTPSYMAPEIVNKKDYTFHVDTWALGILLFKALNGNFPFRGQDDKDLFRKINASKLEFHPSLSQSARNLLTKILTVNIDERYTPEQILQDEWFKTKTSL